MAAYTPTDAIEYMNRKGRAGKPFLFIVNYKADRVLLYEPHEVDETELLYDINGFSNSLMHGAGNNPIHWETVPPTFAVYEKAFVTVLSEIKAGNSYLLNLTFPTLIRTNLSPRSLFLQAKAPYKIWLKDQFVCFSPEIFVRIQDGCIRSFPMKGTIDASLPDAEKRILSDRKEAAEHATIVDLIRNDLSRIASDVHVKRYRYVDKLITNRGSLLQVSSEIEGRLSDDWAGCIGDILFALLPAGSICGAPKRKTLEIIHEAETDERGFYTGIAGYFDGSRLDSAVLIRFIEEKDGQLYFRSGGGITAQSDMEKEYNEIKQKVYAPIY